MINLYSLFKYLLSIGIFSLSSIINAHAAWTQNQGQWFTAQQFNFFQTSEFVQDDGQKIKRPPFRKYEWNSYFEYGWTDETTVGANLFIHRLEAAEDRFDPAVPFPVRAETQNFGLADSEIFLRHRLWQGNLLNRNTVIAIQPLLKFPSFYPQSDSPESGTDNFDAELRLQTGYDYEFLDKKHFLKLETGYRKRYGEWRDQWKIDAASGLQLTEKFTFLQQFFITARAEGSGVNNQSLTSSNDYDLLKGQFSLLYEAAPKTTLQLGVFSHLVARNTGSGEGLTFGIWHRF